MVINEKGVLKVYEKILRHKKKVNISIESKRIAKIFDYNPKIVYGIIKKKATEEFREDEHPREDDGKFTDKGGGVGSSTRTKTRRRKSRSKTKTARRKVKRSKIKMRSRKSKDSGQRKHNIKTYPNTNVVITGITTNTYDKTFSPELVTIFEDFWNSDLSVKKMRKHIDYLGLLYQKNPKRGGFWNTLEKKVVIYDAYWQTPSHFKNTVVHEIVGHTFWDLAREYFRNDLIEFNELANKMPPVNGYVKDNEEAWKNYNDEIHTQMQVLDKKYGLDDFTSPEDKLWGDKLEKYQEDYAKISDGKFIGNPSNKFMNRDSSSMTRYANEQHSAITEIIYRTLNGSFEEGAKDILIGKEDKEKLIEAWYKLHPNVPQKAGESWNDPFKNHNNIISTEEFKEQEHPRDNDGKFAIKGNQMFKTNVAFSQPIDILDDNKKRIDEMLKELEMMTKKGKLRKGDYKTNMSVKIKYNDEKYDDIYSLQTSIDRKTIYAVFRELGRMEYYSDIDESLVEKLDPYKKAVYNKMKRLHESIESDKSIKKIGFTGKLDIETTMNYRFNLEKSYVFGSAWGGTKEKREYADRIGTEVITPLINSDVHMYYIEDEHDDFFNKQIDEMLEYAYNELKYMNSKNIWTKELGNMMNVKLYSGSGEFNTKDFKLDELKSKENFVASGFWGKDGNSINIFNRHPSYPFRNPTSQVLAHELTHSIFDARKRQAYDGDKDAKALLEKLTEVSINIDPEIVGRYLGTYAKSYVDTYHKEGRKGWGINLETELLSAITDSINPRYNNFFSGKKNYTVKTMKKHMPELMEVYEKIFGKEHKWEEDPQPKITFNDSVKQKHIPIGRIADYESDVSIEYDVQFIDGNRNIVPKEEATNVIRKGYRGNKLISFEHLIVPPNPIVTEAEFREEDHPRGQPDNAGQFTSKGDSSSKDALHIGKEEKEKIENYGNSLDIEPKKEEVDKAVNIESKVIGGVYDFIKDKSYKDKIKWVETQGSFAKGTDLGSSDLDIFIGFDYSLSIDEIQEITLDIGENVLKPISDSDKYKIKHGADKDYPESYVDNIEVQIIGTSDVTLDQIRKGFDEGGMKTATDRTPHHTRFMKKALKGKEQEVRKLKKFFKNSGVYDSSMAKQGFSGFSTEVLIHNLGSFAKVIGYFANFVKGSVVGKTDRKFNTPLVMIDPLDPNRNLASAFSHSERDGNIAPNKNLGRLIKSAKSLVKTGKLPNITKEKLPSISVNFHVDNTLDNNEVFGQLYSSALSMSATLKRNGYIVKSPKDKITKDFTVDVPRINVDYDEYTGKATLNFALDNFDKKYRYVGGIPEDLPDDKLRAFYDNHKGEKLVKKNGKIYAEQESEYPTAEKLMKAIVSGEKKNSTVGKNLKEYIKQAVISKEDREYENITDKPSSTEGLSKILNTNNYIRKEDVRQLAKDLLEAERY